VPWLASTAYRIGYGPIASPIKITDAVGSTPEWCTVDISRDPLIKEYAKRGMTTAIEAHQIKIKRNGQRIHKTRKAALIESFELLRESKGKS
jgi:hypothetical protein